MVLAIRIRRSAFESMLHHAVLSTHDAARYASQADFQAAIAASSVRIQWDPDHDPQGNRLDRRAIQVGLRGPSLRQYATESILEIQDISDFVREQKEYALAGQDQHLLVPVETVYPVSDPDLAARIGLSVGL